MRTIIKDKKTFAVCTPVLDVKGLEDTDAYKLAKANSYLFNAGDGNLEGGVRDYGPDLEIPFDLPEGTVVPDDSMGLRYVLINVPLPEEIPTL